MYKQKNILFSINKVNQEIAEMEANIDMLQQAIDGKLAPMQVAQTRLDTRTHRPNLELCRDRVQYKLIEEVRYSSVKNCDFFC